MYKRICKYKTEYTGEEIDKNNFEMFVVIEHCI